MSPTPSQILFLGTSSFAVASLKALANDPRFNVLAVITQKDQPVGRNRALTAPPVKEEALKLGLDVLQPQDIRSEFHSMNLPRPDFLVVVSYGQILSQEILDFATVASVNVHASLLPRWRGASPIQHAILSGDSVTGVTVQKMVKELDAGPILAQEATPIGARETSPMLHERLMKMGAELLVKTLADLPKAVPQDGEVTVCKKLSRGDGDIEASKETAEEIDRKVRALNPWPGVAATLNGKRIKFLEISLEETKHSYALPCKDGTTLFLVTVQPSGKNPMQGDAWARGQR